MSILLKDFMEEMYRRKKREHVRYRLDEDENFIYIIADQPFRSVGFVMDEIKLYIEMLMKDVDKELVELLRYRCDEDYDQLPPSNQYVYEGEKYEKVLFKSRINQEKDDFTFNLLMNISAKTYNNITVFKKLMDIYGNMDRLKELCFSNIIELDIEYKALILDWMNEHSLDGGEMTL